MRRWAGRPLLEAVPGRRPAWALLAACVVVVLGLGLAFAHHTTADWFDRVVDDPLIRVIGPWGDSAYRMSWPGTQIPAVLASLVMAGVCLLQRRLNGVLLALAADFAATRLDDPVLKDLFHRTYLGSLVYPSGHTTSIVTLTAVYVVLFMLPPETRLRPLRLVLLALLLVFVVFTVVGVIALRWHYFTDTIGGAAVAVGTVCALCLLLDWLWRALGLRAAP